ncbi:hypothetical protein KVR01_012117 [Diaporthe batatas]|uniref:uncharacterized protein n=1 Tax=Diaporthe batatas TaxID=748121 RepID=UPI001D040AA6|nr:uncharacterized protein KVR01_012117 [Diaporthe batatas]KAG8158356.1 hypothetical protein KVR01_012117 [Diaporthe batatas]
MSGAEAIATFALVCNILQTIELGFKAASICKNIYKTGSSDPDEDIDEKRLAQISEDTLATAEKLKVILEKPAAAQGRKLDSIKWGLHRALKKGDVDKLDRHLKKQKAVLETGLLSRICTQSEAHKIEMSTEFSHLSGALQGFVKGISDGQNDLQRLVQTSAKETQTKMTQHMDKLNLSSDDKARRDKILSSLKAPKLNSRRTRIDEPHESTFAWIFQSEWTGYTTNTWTGRKQYTQPNTFPQWCQDVTAKIFWMNGKAGSGKSTLMKHLVDSEDTQRLLNSTSPNTLILSNQPHFIPTMSTANLMQKDEPDDWSPQELQNTILETVKTLGRPVCIFLDGLDEIGDDGPDKLLALIEVLLADKNIRLCVSSRPDPAFHKRFGLLDAVCDKANGVFLWVSLALKAMGEGVVRDDDQDQLMRRLEALPRELKSLYQEMWDRENGEHESYRKDAALWLNLMLEGEDIVPWHTLSVWHFLLVRKTEYLDKIFDSPAPLEQIKTYSRELLNTKRQLESRCAGLLEVRTDENTNHLVVSFIHRSAKEFLMNSNREILGYDQTTPEFRMFVLLKSCIVIPESYSKLYLTVPPGVGEISGAAPCREVHPDYDETGLDPSKPRAQPGITMPDYQWYCGHLRMLKKDGHLDSEMMIKLFQATKKIFDHTDQMHVRCDFVALAASQGMWEYVYAVMEDFRANSPNGKISTTYSTYLFCASFGIPGAPTHTYVSSSEDRMRISRMMQKHGIDLDHKCIESQYFESRVIPVGRPQIALLRSPQMLVILRIIQERDDLEDRRSALEVLASIVVHGYDLDEKTLIIPQWDDALEEIYVGTLPFIAQHGQSAAMFKSPLLATRLREVISRVKWEPLTDHEEYERLKLVGNFVPVDADICKVPKPF